MNKLERKVEIPKVFLESRKSRLVNGQGEYSTLVRVSSSMELTA